MGVHSHVDHLEAILDLVDKQVGLPVHAILDGRDTPPASARPHIDRFYRRSLGGGTVTSPRSAGVTTPWIGTGAGAHGEGLSRYVYGEGNCFSDPAGPWRPTAAVRPMNLFSRW